MKVLNRSELFAESTGSRIEKLPIGAGVVYVRSMTFAETRRWLAISEKERERSLLVLAVSGLCSEKGGRMFLDDEEDQLGAAMAWPDVEQIAAAVLRLSGLTPAEGSAGPAEARDPEKNSGS